MALFLMISEILTVLCAGVHIQSDHDATVRADPGVEIGGHIGPYGVRGARAYNGRLGGGLCPLWGPGTEPLKLNSFLCCLKWRKAAMFMNCFMVIQCDRAMAIASASICVTRDS